MMKLSASEQDGRITTIEVEGWVAGEHSELLEAECQRRLDEGYAVQLDLSSVTYVDQSGARVLGRLEGDGVTLIGCSPFLLEFVSRRDPS